MAGGRLTREAVLKIVADDGDAALKIDRIKEKADELRALHPELKLKSDTAETAAKLKIFKAQLDLATRDKTVHIEVKTGKLGKLGMLPEKGLGALLCAGGAEARDA